MTFVSIEFLIFLPIVFLLYWIFCKKSKTQKTILLFASNIFYSFWDYRFMLLLNLTILIDFFCGLKIDESINNKTRKLYLFLSIVSCLTILFYFKYFNFFIESAFFLLKIKKSTLEGFLIEVTLPIGISFYTFHGISYVVDIYNKKIKSETELLNYSLFVSFFPLLVAGPIERATNLLQQFKNRISFNYFDSVYGIRLILWGFLKKIVIADNLSVFVTEIFGNHTEYSGSTLLLGIYFFSIQIYCDFSGYSDIAIGTAKLFGFKLVKNFNYPYFSENIIDFWKKWHISLTSFFRDYIYIPIGGSKSKSTALIIRNILVVFILSGIWHGASFNFILWGIYHGLIYLITKYFIFIRIMLPLTIKYLFTFIIVTFGWIFFRITDFKELTEILIKIFSSEIISTPYFRNGTNSYLFILISTIFFMIEYISVYKKFESPMMIFNKIANPIFRYVGYLVIIFLIIYLGNFSENSFIYFQF